MTDDAPLILNVDDDEAQRYVKTRDLRLSGFNVVEAASATEALTIIERDSPSVVLLDVQLPDLMGPEVCVHIKRRWPGVMVLMTSSTFTGSPARTVSLNSGADSYLVQPAERLELAAAINSLLRIRKSEDDLRSLNASLERKIEERTAELREMNAKLTGEISQRENAEAALIQAQKLEAMGQLTGGVAHDFNNLLTPIVAALDVLQRRAFGGDREQRLIGGALQSAERAKTLVQRLLAFARRQPLQAGAVDIGGLIGGMAELLRSTIGPQIRLVVDVAEGLPLARADANQLEMAILNLAVNARDAMEQGGTLTIAAHPLTADSDRSLKLKPGPYVRISVIDTGCGMDETVVARAIEPFFSTKGAGRGTGLGLSMAHGLASQLGGALTIASKKGAGASIELLLPVTDEPAVHPFDEDREHLAGLRAGKVLLVDDEEMVRLTASDMLSELGFGVVEAESAERALQMLSAGLFVDLVITDQLMPGMTGAELAAAVRTRWPDVRILIVSGFADAAGLTPDLARLHKPFRQTQLKAALAQLGLGGAPAPAT